RMRGRRWRSPIGDMCWCREPTALPAPVPNCLQIPRCEAPSWEADGLDFLNALVVFANFVLLPAMTYGAQLALGALGATLIYGILRFSNFAHGDTMAFGTMATILVTWMLQAAGLSFAPLPTA